MTGVQTCALPIYKTHNFLIFVVFSSDAVLLWVVFDVFWGLRCVLVGFMLVDMVNNCKLWVL